MRPGFINDAVAVNAAHQRHLSGESLKEVAVSVGVSRSLITLAFKKHQLAVHVRPTKSMVETRRAGIKRHYHRLRSEDHQSRKKLSEDALRFVLDDSYTATTWAELHEKQRLAYSEIAQEIGVSPMTVSKRFAELDLKCRIDSKTMVHRSISRLLDEIGVRHVHNTRKIIPPHETDIWCPDHGVAIECDGEYWHRDRKSHSVVKHDAADDAGIRLVSVWRSQWLNSNDKFASHIKDMFVPKQKIGARKCEIVVLDRVDARKFNERHHLMGDASCAQRKDLALVHPDHGVVCVAGLGRRKSFKSEDLELVRWTVLPGFSVIGGLRRLCSRIEEDVYSFIDRRLHTGKGFVSSGFTFAGKSSPGFHYFDPKNNKTHSRFASWRPRFDDSEMWKCWDAGQLKYVLRSR